MYSFLYIHDFFSRKSQQTIKDSSRRFPFGLFFLTAVVNTRLDRPTPNLLLHWGNFKETFTALWPSLRWWIYYLCFFLPDWVMPLIMSIKILPVSWAKSHKLVSWEMPATCICCISWGKGADKFWCFEFLVKKSHIFFLFLLITNALVLGCSWKYTTCKSTFVVCVLMVFASVKLFYCKTSVLLAFIDYWISYFSITINCFL